MNAVSTFLSTAALFFSLGLQAQGGDLTWPNGQNVCTGSWSYTKLASCDYADDLSRPTYVDETEYYQVPNSCKTWNVPYAVVGTHRDYVEWEDTSRFTVARGCDEKKPADIDGFDKWVRTNGIPDVDPEGAIRGRCRKRNRLTRKCESWYYVHRSYCTFERRQAQTSNDAAHCGTTQHSRIVKRHSGYHKLSGYHASCPGATTVSLPPLSSRDALTGPDVQGSSIKCSTLDEVSTTSPEAVRQKFDTLMALAFDLASRDSSCQEKNAVHRALSAVASEQSDKLAQDQLDLVFATLDTLPASCD